MNVRRVVALAAAVLLSVGGMAKADPITLDGADRTTRVVRGQLAGACVSSVYGEPTPTEVCPSVALAKVDLRLLTPKGKRGRLVIKVESPLTNGGFTLRVIDAWGEVVGSFSALRVRGYAGSPALSAADLDLEGLRAGRYSVELSVLAGVADYTETITWTIRR